MTSLAIIGIPKYNDSLIDKESPSVLVALIVNADFFTLYDDAQTLLSKDLISVEERELLPGAHYEYDLELEPKTEYVGILVAFKEIDKAKWISVAQVPEKKWFDLINKPSK